MGMDSTLARYWGRKIRNAYEQSQWTDQAGQNFCGQELSQLERDLNRLGETGECVSAFVKKAEQLFWE